MSVGGKSRCAVLLCVVLLGGAGCEFEDAPPILWTAVRPHKDEGACTNCHVRLDMAGNSVPDIRSWARMPHADRGVCSNCHRVTTGGGGVSLSRDVKELRNVEWLGMQLSPAGGASGLPAGAGGLLVVEAEGRAQAAGIVEGDVLTAVNGFPVASFADLHQATLGRPVDSGVLTILRAGQMFSLPIGNAVQAATGEPARILNAAPPAQPLAVPAQPGRF